MANPPYDDIIDVEACKGV